MQLGCRDLTVGYDGKAILKNINFSVEEGEYLSIVGENGSGKSTLMRTLLRLQQPLSGEVILGNGLNREEIGYLPQQTVIQKDFPASVREIVLSGCQNRCGLRPFYNREEKEYAYQMMEKMQIIHLEKRCYRELSGGQQQRVLLARALCATRKILLLDEPTAGLDVMARESILNLFREYMEEDGERTILISSHISSDLEGLCDDIYMIHEGRIIFHEDTDVLLNQYGLLKVDEKQFEELDKRYLLKKRKEHYGYACLTKEKQYYIENYPDIVVEKGTVDELIAMMIGGNEL